MTTYFLSKDDALLNSQRPKPSVVSASSRTNSLSPKVNISPVKRTSACSPILSRQPTKYPGSPPGLIQSNAPSYGNAGGSPSLAYSSTGHMPPPVNQASMSAEQPHTSSHRLQSSSHVSFQNATTSIHPQVYNVPPIAAVEPSPVKPVVQQPEDKQALHQKAPMPGYGEQKSRLAKTDIVVPSTNKVCSSSCTIL